MGFTDSLVLSSDACAKHGMAIIVMFGPFRKGNQCYLVFGICIVCVSVGGSESRWFLRVRGIVLSHLDFCDVAPE
eukprot:6492373-Amphidinium_carterae.1